MFITSQVSSMGSACGLSDQKLESSEPVSEIALQEAAFMILKGDGNMHQDQEFGQTAIQH